VSERAREQGPRERCRCIVYEKDTLYESCFCGHSIEEHSPTKEHPGDTSCKAAESEEADD
jgi:hypothetical protein